MYRSQEVEEVIEQAKQERAEQYGKLMLLLSFGPLAIVLIAGGLMMLAGGWF